MVIMLGEVYMRSSTPATIALDFAEHNPAVQEAVGGVEHAQLNWIGNIHYDGNEGWASFEVQVTGARTNGTIDVMLQRQRRRWNVDERAARHRFRARRQHYRRASGIDQPGAVN